MTRREWLDMATQCLWTSESPHLCASLLLCHTLHVDRVSLIAYPGEAIPESALIVLSSLLVRRMAGEPMAYLLGVKEFYGRTFAVNMDTLIPRPETELLVDEALKRLPGREIKFLDLGTGSGCLAVTLAAERGWRGTAVDISQKALDIARANADTFNVADKIDFMLADFSLRLEVGEVDLLVSNPPYVSEAEYGQLDKDIGFEPKQALVPGPDEFGLLRCVIRTGEQSLRHGGLLLLEHGFKQGEATRTMCDDSAWDEVLTGKDLAGLDRYLIAVRR